MGPYFQYIDMSLTQNEIPDSTSLAGNQMWADFSTDEIDKAFIGIYFLVEEWIDSAYTLQGKELRYEPDANGNAKIDVHSLLAWEPEKEFSWPENPSTLIVRRNSLRKLYRIHVKEKFGNPLAENDETLGSARYALPGKISDLRMGKINDDQSSWGELNAAEKFFLTNSPKQKVTDPWSSERLYYYASGISSSAMNLIVKVTYDDDSTKEIARDSFGGFQNRDVFEIITSFSTLGIFFLDTSKTIVKYEVWLTDSNNSLISEVFTYLVDHTPYDSAKYFLFSNAYKMIEGVRFIGASKKESQIEQMSVNRTLPKGYGVMDASISKTQSVEVEYREARTGFMSEDEMNWLRELLLSQEVYEIVNGSPVRIEIDGDSVGLQDDNSNLRTLTIRYRYAHKDSVPAILPTIEDIVDNFQLTEIDLNGMSNGDADENNFYSFFYDNATGEFLADTRGTNYPIAYSNDDIELPFIPMLACYSNYSRTMNTSVLQIRLLAVPGYTQEGFKEINIDPDEEAGFGILMTGNNSVKFGVLGSESENENIHAMNLKLYIPTKRCLEYLYEESL